MWASRSTPTPTGSARVKKLFGDRVFHVYLPYDLPRSVARFLDRVKPKLAVVMETEIWPNLLRECRSRGIKTIVINGRISARSYPRYRLVRPLFRRVLADIDRFCMQSEESARRIIDLGADIQVNNATQLSVPGAQAGWTYLWSTGAGTPTITVTQSGIYAVTVTDQNGCTATDAVQVTLKKKFHIWVPNAFSPNGDKINDTWEIENLGDYGFAIVEIFNRNGQIVYKSIGYNKPWDGTRNGKPLPVGIYYFVIDKKDGTNKLSGWISLMR